MRFRPAPCGHLLSASPVLLVFAGLVLTYYLQLAPQEAALRALQDEFDLQVREITDRIEHRLRNYEQVLAGASGLFVATGNVPHSVFTDYVRALKLDGKYPGIQGVGYAQRIAPHAVTGRIAARRADGFPHYDLRPADVRSPYSAIIYLEPSNWRNQRAIGYDMYSEPVRRAAMEAARDEELARISGKVTLVQETDRDVQAGFLMYLPVYRHGSPHVSLQERRANLVGWVYAPFRMNDLLQGALGQRLNEINAALGLKIYDGEAVDTTTLMFDSHAGEEEGVAPAFSHIRSMNLFGHHWTVLVHSHPVFDARLKSEKATFIRIAGVFGSLLLGLVAWLLVTGRDRARSMAESMTIELRRSEAAQRRLNRALRLLSDCNMALVQAIDEHRLLTEICRLCVERGGYVMAWVGYAEHDSEHTVRPIAHAGDESGFLQDIRVSWADTPHGRGPSGCAIRTAQPHVNTDVRTHPGMEPWRRAAIERGYLSSVALPLIGDARVLGVLHIYAGETDAFDAQEVHLLEELAGDLAYGILTLRTREEHAATKEKLDFLANFDPLTLLPNRVLLRDRFEHAALLARKHKSILAMLYLDLDNFQHINDSLGHAAGDAVLTIAVERLRHCIPATETLSRLSGDEFVILLTGCTDIPSVASMANALREAFTEPVAVEGKLLSTAFSIGISLYPQDGTDFDTLLKHADTAVHQAKEAGRNTYRFFSNDMNADLVEQLQLTGGFTYALRNQEFVLYYQPQICLHTQRLLGAEALIRWKHPSLGLVPPSKFIPLAEQSGHIVPIGEWVLHEACRQARRWCDLFGADAPAVAVNLSAMQFSRSDVPERVSHALRTTGLAAAQLELELTESMLLHDVHATMKTLHGLKALGVKLSIDDFGTGYSSLSYLKQLAVDTLKIDQSFVRDMLADRDGASIAQAIIQLGHTLELNVIAEGVECPDQLAFLQASGCDAAQGHLFSHALPADQFEALLERACRHVWPQNLVPRPPQPLRVVDSPA